MTEIVLVPELKLPVIECECGLKYFLGTITEALLPEPQSFFCPFCGKPKQDYQSVPLDSQALVGQDWPSSRAQQE